MDLTPLSRQAGHWLRTLGPESDVVVSSRVRLARNISRHPFPNQATAEQRQIVQDKLHDILDIVRVGQQDTTVRLDRATSHERSILRERHLISREQAENTDPTGRSVRFAQDETIAAMINEEDHLRLHSVTAGLDLGTPRERVHLLGNAIGDHVELAFHDRFGYLTSCPTNTGTGLRAGVMLHLPALMLQKHIEKVMQAAQRMGMVVRGAYGEGSAPSGHLFQVSNQVTLGRSEDDLIAGLLRLIRKVIEYEREMRRIILKDQRDRIEDRVSRCLGILRSARMLTTEEALTHLSDLRLGLALSLIEEPISAATLNEFYIIIQPAHLRQLTDDGSTDPDTQRATYLRKRLKENPLHP